MQAARDFSLFTQAQVILSSLFPVLDDSAPYLKVNFKYVTVYFHILIGYTHSCQHNNFMYIVQ